VEQNAQQHLHLDPELTHTHHTTAHTRTYKQPHQPNDQHQLKQRTQMNTTTANTTRHTRGTHTHPHLYLREICETSGRSWYCPPKGMRLSHLTPPS
jgi:hypothetical protein